MPILIFKVNDPMCEVQGIKELIATEIEKKYRGVRCVEIREDDPPEQMRINK